MSDLTEKEALLHFIDGVKRAEGSARVLGLYRSDPRWVQIAGLIGHIADAAAVLATQGLGPQRRILS